MASRRVRDPYRPSLATRYIEVESNGHVLASATGFLVKHEGRLHLVTNAHVVSGLAPDRSILHESGAVPDTICIRHLVADAVGGGARFEVRRQPLTSGFTPLWFEHPVHRREVDVAALPLDDEDVWSGVYDPWAPPRVDVGVGDDVFVVGYPFGVNADGLAIWTRASVASEFYVDYDGLPCFLVDARTRSGQSGSPVLFFRPGGYFDRFGTAKLPGLPTKPPTPGQEIDPDAPRPEVTTEELLGIYSGRVRGDADL